MIRTCPRCGDFYADGPLAFCPADGTPLADVDPHGDAWAEATRVVEEKGRALLRRTRRLRLRRVMTITTTVLITTLVVCVVVINLYVYLVPRPGEPAVAAALAPTPTPTPRRSETPTPTPTPDSTSLPFVPAVTPTPPPDAAATPDRIRNPSGPANPDDTSTPTPTPPPTPTPKATPTVEETPNDGTPPRSPTPTPTPTPRPTPTPGRTDGLVMPDPAHPPRPTPKPEPAPALAPEPEPEPEPASAPRCKGGDRKRMKRELVAKYEAAWRSAIREDRAAVSRQYAPHGAERPEAELLMPITYEVEFSNSCEPVFVRAEYKWRIRWHGGPRLFRSCTKTKDGRKTFPCRKDEAEWRCV